MILQNKNIISLKPGLYLRLAKLRGYSIIEYTPVQNSSCVFSTNCKLDCGLNFNHINNLTCDRCGEELSLYTDPIMGQFDCKVRIDLVENKFCKLPTTSNLWGSLPKVQEQQLSHVQYYKALRQIKDPQLRECLNNYYNYQVLPVVYPKSYWKHYSSLPQQSYCIYSVIDPQGNEEVWLLIGEDTRFLLELEKQLIDGIVDCAYLNHFLALLCHTTSNSADLLILELPSCQSSIKPIKSRCRFRLPSSVSSCPLVYSLNFEYEKLSLVSFNRESKVASLYQIQNVMSSTPKIEIVGQVQHKGVTNDKEFLFPFLTSNPNCFDINETCIRFLQIGVESIQLQTYNKCIALENTLKLTGIQGIFVQQNGSHQYFYQIQEKQTKILIFSQSAPKLTPFCMTREDFVYSEINQIVEKDNRREKIICQKPVVDGCLYFQYSNQEGQIKIAKSCIF